MKWLLPTDICLVTGGNSGLGREILHQFARQGCQTVSLDINNSGHEIRVSSALSSFTNVDSSIEILKNERSSISSSDTSSRIQPETLTSSSDKRKENAIKEFNVPSGLAETATDVQIDLTDAGNENGLSPTLSIECDVRNQNDLENARKIILSKFGRPPTVIVLNAGVRHPMLSIAESTFDDLQNTIDVNLCGVSKSIRTFLPDIIAQGRGFVVTISSASGIVVPRGSGAYGASKAGLISIHEGLVQELAEHKDVHASSVCPGQLDSAMFADIRTPSDILAPVVSTQKLAEKIVKRVKKAKTSTIYAPAYVRYLPFMQVFPVSISRLLRRMSGIDAVYDQVAHKENAGETEIENVPDNTHSALKEIKQTSANKDSELVKNFQK